MGTLSAQPQLHTHSHREIHSMTLNCLNFFECYWSVLKCIELNWTVLNCIQLYGNIFIELYLTVFSCIQLYSAVFNCIQLYKTVSIFIALYWTILNNIEMYGAFLSYIVLYLCTQWYPQGEQLYYLKVKFTQDFYSECQGHHAASYTSGADTRWVFE